MPPIRSPATLLLLTGALLGLTFPLGKIASTAEVSPIVWAWWVSFGAGGCMLLVLPNLLIFSVIPRLGSGFTGVLFTLSPVFTLLLSALWRVRAPGALGIFGIVLGFAGAVIVTGTREKSASRRLGSGHCVVCRYAGNCGQYCPGCALRAAAQPCAGARWRGAAGLAAESFGVPARRERLTGLVSYNQHSI